MSPPKSRAKYEPRPSGMMEFRPATVDDARAVLDAIPPDVARVLEGVPGYWQKNRRPALATDRALTGRAMDWLGQLPDGIRPYLTIERYPRIVNAIADSWPDVGTRTQMFEHLLNDRRIGRRGFPLEIEREIAALCLHASNVS